jgi:hypothetical protein
MNGGVGNRRMGPKSRNEGWKLFTEGASPNAGISIILGRSVGKNENR